MISIKAKIILGFFAVVLVGSGLLIWLILAFGNGFWAMVAPLAVGGLVCLVTLTALTRGEGDGPSE